jgi:hypothetical protein
MKTQQFFNVYAVVTFKLCGIAAEFSHSIYTTCIQEARLHSIYSPAPTVSRCHTSRNAIKFARSLFAHYFKRLHSRSYLRDPHAVALQLEIHPRDVVPIIGFLEPAGGVRRFQG